MIGSPARAGALLLAGLATVAPVAAEAVIAVPACAELADWVVKFDAKDKVALSRTNKTLWLHGLLLAKETEQVFGQPALGWSAADVGAADKQLAACANEARRGGAARAGEAKALDAFRVAAIKQLGATLEAAAVADMRIDGALSALMAQPPSRELMRALAAIGKAQGAEDMPAFNADLATLPNGPAALQARALWVALRDGPIAAGDRVFPPIDKRLAELREVAVDEATAALTTQPATPAGLRTLKPLLAKIKAELGIVLSPAELAALDAAAAARSEAIEDAMLAGEMARIAEAPVDMDGLQVLQAVRIGQVAASLSVPRAVALQNGVNSREIKIMNGIVDARIAELERFPATLAGLREIEAYREDTVRELEALPRPRYASRFVRSWIVRAATLSGVIVDRQVAELDRFAGTLAGLREIESYRREVVPPLLGAVAVPDAERLIDAVDARRDAVAGEALPEFRDTLAAIPASADGLKAFDATMAGLAAAIARLKPPLRDQYDEVARAKLATLPRAVAR